MKNQFLKNARGSIIAIVTLTLLFVVVQVVVAATAPTSVTVFKGGSGTVQQFQLAPKPTPDEPNSYSSSLDGSTQFRVYGSSILSDTIINENAEFRGNYDGGLPSNVSPNNLPTPPGTFNIGYDSVAETPNLAQFQVNGGIRVKALESDTEIGLYCLCANGYGELERCGVFDPSIGETCGA